MSAFDPKIVAFYLPQYHPFKENNEWWGEGFTEWTNVGRAKPLFKGHYQPKVPADLGYYDLRLPQVREQQAALAKEAGIYGFCYWHYWFGNGKQLMNEIIDEVIATKEPNFPFCLGWANESWKSKLWDKDATKDKLLIEQSYFGVKDYEMHFSYALKAFKDPRYITIGKERRPLFIIHSPDLLPSDFIPCWNKLAKEAGIADIFFVAIIMGGKNTSVYKQKGFNYFCTERWGNAYLDCSLFQKILIRISSKLKHVRVAIPYKYAVRHFINEQEDSKENFFPSLIPNWDHSPRSKNRAAIFTGSTPELFKRYAKEVLRIVKRKNNQLVFLKSWNEWGEGNYMEPDLKFHKGYIQALAQAIKEVKAEGD